MFKKHENAGASLFLMELILSILFFALAAAVCVQFFAKSHLLSRDSRALSQGTHQCASIAEICKTAQDEQQAIQLLRAQYPAGSWNGQTMQLHFDRQFVPCAPGQRVYTLQAQLSREDSMFTCDLSLTDADGAVLLALAPEYHIARRLANG